MINNVCLSHLLSRALRSQSWSVRPTDEASFRVEGLFLDGMGVRSQFLDVVSEIKSALTDSKN